MEFEVAPAAVVAYSRLSDEKFSGHCANLGDAMEVRETTTNRFLLAGLSLALGVVVFATQAHAQEGEPAEAPTGEAADTAAEAPTEVAAEAPAEPAAEVPAEPGQRSKLSLLKV